MAKSDKPRSLLEDDDAPRKPKKKKSKKSKVKPAKKAEPEGKVVKKKKKKKNKDVDLGLVADTNLSVLDDDEDVAEDEDLDEEELEEEDDSDVTDEDLEEEEDSEDSEEDEEESEEDEVEESDEESEESDEDSEEEEPSGEEEDDEEDEEEEEEQSDTPRTPEEANALADARGIRVIVEVYKERCTNCTHLVSHAEKRYDECHYLNGNDRCPAKNTYLLRSPPIEDTAEKLLRATLEGNITEENRIRRLLERKYDPLVGRNINTVFLAKLQRHFLEQAGVTPELDETVKDDAGPSPADPVEDAVAVGANEATAIDETPGGGEAATDAPVDVAEVVTAPPAETKAEANVASEVKTATKPAKPKPKPAAAAPTKPAAKATKTVVKKPAEPAAPEAKADAPAADAAPPKAGGDIEDI